MTAASPERVRDLLAAALEREPRDRAAFVRDASAGDAALEREVVSLLRALSRSGNLLEPAPRDASEPRSLTGVRFGSYVVEERIGAGGMGVVYRASDARLGRDVAVKALPSDVADHRERRERLEREARALAALNHPNIAAIYDAVDTERGTLLLLEYVPGRTLAQLIASGGLPLDEALAIARQIALGLEAAHAVGVVHRDLKPGNVRVTEEGVVKLLDFGIAQVVAPGANDGDTPTTPRQTPPMPERVTVWGTAAYMSPEQARGKRTDRRADLWAFGCVLFEMLAGVRAFDGESSSETVAAVLRAEPDWSRLPDATPASARRLLRRCLQKDAERRLRDAADARLEIDEALVELTAPAERAATRRPAWTTLAIVALGCIALGAAITGWLRGGMWVASPAPEPVRFGVRLEQRLPLEWDPGASFALSPDGSTLAFTGYSSGAEQRLYVQRLDEFAPREMRSAGTVRTPTFSSDGRWIYCSDAATGRLRRVRTDTGAAEDVGATSTDSTGIAVTDASRIVFGESRTLWSVDERGEDRRGLTTLNAQRGESTHGQPCAIGNGEIVVFTCERREGSEVRCSVEAVRTSTGERRTLVDDAWAPSFVAPDVIVWQQRDWLLAARLDRERLELTGLGVRLLGPLASGREFMPPARHVMSRSGTCAFLSGGTETTTTTLAWLGRDGMVSTILDADAPIVSVRLSPGGDRAAFSSGVDKLGVWVRDLARGTLTRVAPDDGRSRDLPVWTSDGRRIAVRSDSSETCRIELLDAAGGAAPIVLCEQPRASDLSPTDVTPDGKSLLLTMNHPTADVRELCTLSLDGGEPTWLFDVPVGRSGGRFSPDGRWLAYASEEFDRSRAVAQPWPSLGAPIQISRDEGRRIVWRGDGGAVFYRVRNQLCEAELSGAAAFAASPPRVVLEALPEGRYDVAPDGSRFLVPLPRGASARGDDAERGTRVGVVTHVEVLVEQALRGAGS
ncbi:MAG: protein kinase [Phycisphaerales bacterium]